MARRKQKPQVSRKSGCAIEGCSDPAYSCGLCAACYQWDYYWTRQKNASERRQYVARTERTKARVRTLRPVKSVRGRR